MGDQGPVQKTSVPSWRLGGLAVAAPKAILMVVSLSAFLLASSGRQGDAEIRYWILALGERKDE
jgi:hypothetical protein